MRGRAGGVRLLMLLSAAISTVAIAGPASAVANGVAVRRPATSIPWAVSLFHARSASATPEFRCSGTAISAREILTAGHCVAAPGFYWVSVGGNAVTSGRRVAVGAIDTHRGFRASRWADDVALLRTRASLRLSAYPRLADAGKATAVRTGTLPSARIYGWGQNEKGAVTGLLSSADLVMQSPAAAAAFGTTFRAERMLAAGRYDAAKRTYSGACGGDSGGPLVVQSEGIPYVVGVTSFGGRDCRSSTPTVFTSVGDYAGWIGRARGMLATASLRTAIVRVAAHA